MDDMRDEIALIRRALKSLDHRDHCQREKAINAEAAVDRIERHLQGDVFTLPAVAQAAPVKPARSRRKTATA